MSARYAVEALEARVHAVRLPTPMRPQAPAQSASKDTNAGFALRADAVPPAEKWQALQEIDPAVLASYSGQKKFPSASERDLSLASYCVQAGWSDQEIADLIVACRRLHKDEPAKLLREDYYRRTLARARSGQDGDEPITEEPGKSWAWLHANLCEDLMAVTKVGTDAYHLRFKQGDIHFTPAELLNSQGAVRAKIFGLTNKPPALDKKQWPRAVEHIANVAALDEVEGLSEHEQFMEEVSAYFDGQEVQAEATPKDQETLALMHQPFLSEGYAYFACHGLQQWQRQTGREAATSRDIARKARIYLGAEAVKITTNSHRHSSRWYWRFQWQQSGDDSVYVGYVAPRAIFSNGAKNGAK